VYPDRGIPWGKKDRELGGVVKTVFLLLPGNEHKVAQSVGLSQSLYWRNLSSQY
jgi:hypothetical protein